MAYDSVTLEALSVQIMYLSLTLVKLILNQHIQVQFLHGPHRPIRKDKLMKSHSYINNEIVADPLNSNILPHRPKLIINIFVICLFILPSVSQ